MLDLRGIPTCSAAPAGRISAFADEIAAAASLVMGQGDG
jgi:hypothetical protein